jgi:hypothetical protein
MIILRMACVLSLAETRHAASLHWVVLNRANQLNTILVVESSIRMVRGRFVVAACQESPAADSNSSCGGGTLVGRVPCAYQLLLLLRSDYCPPPTGNYHFPVARQNHTYLTKHHCLFALVNQRHLSASHPHAGICSPRHGSLLETAPPRRTAPRDLFDICIGHLQKSVNTPRHEPQPVAPT